MIKQGQVVKYRKCPLIQGSHECVDIILQLTGPASHCRDRNEDGSALSHDNVTRTFHLS